MFSFGVSFYEPAVVLWKCRDEGCHFAAILHDKTGVRDLLSKVLLYYVLRSHAFRNEGANL